MQYTAVLNDKIGLNKIWIDFYEETYALAFVHARNKAEEIFANKDNIVVEIWESKFSWENQQ
jgi:hypothetical protein